jgi:hypothetical protein
MNFGWWRHIKKSCRVLLKPRQKLKTSSRLFAYAQQDYYQSNVHTCKTELTTNLKYAKFGKIGDVSLHLTAIFIAYTSQQLVHKILRLNDKDADLNICLAATDTFML